LEKGINFNVEKFLFHGKWSCYDERVEKNYDGGLCVITRNYK
jgi:hypothetical protein